MVNNNMHNLCPDSDILTMNCQVLFYFCIEQVEINYLMRYDFCFFSVVGTKLLILGQTEQVSHPISALVKRKWVKHIALA
jgi:hypothetical protein